MAAPDIKQIIHRLAAGETLAAREMHDALDLMTTGGASPVQMGAALMALRVRGETVDEITGAAQLLRECMTRVEAPADAVDTL